MSEFTTESASWAKAASIIAFLTQTARGPREAYAILCAAIWILNFKIVDTPSSIDELCSDVTTSLRSIQTSRHPNDA